MISKPKPKTLSVSQPVQKTNLKRKNPNQPDEFNPKLVRTKLTSAENTNPNNQDLIQINLKKGTNKGFKPFITPLQDQQQRHRSMEEKKMSPKRLQISRNHKQEIQFSMQLKEV